MLLNTVIRSQQWIRAVQIASVSALVLALWASPAFATFPGANGRITYSPSKPTISAGIFGVLPDGSDTKRLTGPHTAGPGWSADGRRLLFVRDLNPNGAQPRVDIFIRGSDGTKRRVTNTPHVDEMDPSFAPGGKRIVVSCSPRPSLISMRLDGTHRRILHSFDGGALRDPEYSPDGTQIVYEHQDAIWVASADLSQTKRVTNPVTRDFGPHWEPDGQYIIFMHCTNNFHPGCRPRDELVRPDGTGLQVVNCGRSFEGSQNHQALISPANDSIVEAQRTRMMTAGRTCPPIIRRELPVEGVIGDLDWQPL